MRRPKFWKSIRNKADQFSKAKLTGGQCTNARLRLILTGKSGHDGAA
jgi:hypothetical protein